LKMIKKKMEAINLIHFSKVQIATKSILKKSKKPKN